MNKKLIQPLNSAKHMQAILQIEQEVHTDPWDAKTFRNCLTQKNIQGIVVIFENEVCGYLIYEVEEKSLKILNLTVSPHRQRFGLGSELVNALKTWVYPYGTVEMKLSERCLEAHLFLAKQGFRAEQVIKNFFKIDECVEDAYCFVYRPVVKSTVKLELNEIRG